MVLDQVSRKLDVEVLERGLFCYRYAQERRSLFVDKAFNAVMRGSTYVLVLKPLHCARTSTTHVVYGYTRPVFGLFSKKTKALEWKLFVSVYLPALAECTGELATAGMAVGRDFRIGWSEVEGTLQRLPVLKSQTDSIQNQLKLIGSPINSPELSAVKKSLDLVFDQLVLVYHWGGYHYKDASGQPGQRALYETGFAQSAALKRVTNNGQRFSLASVTAHNGVLSAASGLNIDLTSTD